MIHRNEKLWQRAVEPTVDAIGAIEARVPSRILTAALADIRQQFSQPDYQVGDLKRRIGGGNSFANAFHHEVGLPPWKFIQECRMETSTRLMRDTSLPLDEVAFLVGYLSLCAFRRLCRRWCGLSPGEWRAGLRRVGPRLIELPEEVITWHYWERCLTGQLDPEQAWRLIAYLEQIHGIPAGRDL